MSLHTLLFIRAPSLLKNLKHVHLCLAESSVQSEHVYLFNPLLFCSFNSEFDLKRK